MMRRNESFDVMIKESRDVSTEMTLSI